MYLEYRILANRTPLLIKTPGHLFGRTLVISGKNLPKRTVMFWRFFVQNCLCAEQKTQTLIERQGSICVNTVSTNIFPNVHQHIVVAYEQLKMLICENISVQKHEEITGTRQDLVNRFWLSHFKKWEGGIWYFDWRDRLTQGFDWHTISCDNLT